MEINKNPKTVIVVLICIILFHIINNYFWIRNDVLSWYHEKYYQLIAKNTVLSSLRKITQSDAPPLGRFLSVLKLIEVNVCGWTGLYYIYTAYVNLMFRDNINVSLMANMPTFILLIIFTFLIGGKIAGESEGILAAFLVSFYPGIYGIPRSYGLDFPLTTMVTVSMYILIAKDITKIRYALLFGLIMGLTLLIKIQGICFLIGPLAYIFYQHIYKYSSQKDNFTSRHILKIILAFGLSISLVLSLFNLGWPSWPKYIFNEVFNFSSHIRHFYQGCPYNLFDIRSLSFYPFEMMQSMSKLLFLFFLIAFLLFWKAKIKYKAIIYLWISIPYIIFTVSLNKWSRYYFPALPALALITATGLLQISSKRYKLILISAIIFLSLIQFYDLSFGTTILPRSLYTHPWYSFSAYPPQKCEEDKVVTHFLERINKERKSSQYRLTVLLVGLPELIDSGKLEYIFQTKEVNIEFAKFFTSSSNYKNCDYIIVVNNETNDTDKLDLSFLKTFNWVDFLAANYPGYHISKAELEDIYNTFIKFKVIDYYLTDNLIFHLCKNTKD